MEKIKLLFVEDDATFAFIVKDCLELTGLYQVQTASNGKEGLEVFHSFNPDVVVTDIVMPVMDGIEMISQIRRTNESVPILFASGQTNAQNVSDEYKLNANNFVKKPFFPEELDAHVQAVLKRAKMFSNKRNEYRVYIGNMIFDTDKQYLHYENEKYKLSARESRILHKLYINKGYVVKRDELLEEIWGINNFFTSRSLDVFVNSLRKRLSLDPKINIETIRGKGLVLNVI